MKNVLIKKEHGSITLFVLVSMLFLTMFLMTIYTLSTNNEVSQREATKKIKEIYEVGVNDIESVYEKVKDKIPLITFTIEGTTYQAKEGMTWKEWIDDTSLNTINLHYESETRSNI